MPSFRFDMVAPTDMPWSAEAAALVQRYLCRNSGISLDSWTLIRIDPVPQKAPASLSRTSAQRPMSPRRASTMSPGFKICWARLSALSEVILAIVE